MEGVCFFASSCLLVFLQAMALTDIPVASLFLDGVL